MSGIYEGAQTSMMMFFFSRASKFSSLYTDKKVPNLLVQMPNMDLF